jgi:acetylornithine deacetylase/succinyl-diaminopimelate desuccinylase-like protein
MGRIYCKQSRAANEEIVLLCNGTYLNFTSSFISTKFSDMFKVFFKTIAICILTFPPRYGHAQTPLLKVKQFIKINRQNLLSEYIQFVSIPNVSSDSVNIPRNTAFIRQMMEQQGIATTLLHGTTPGVNPAVFGEVKVPGAKGTIAFYAHYDGQPVNPKQWFAGLEPFRPVFITAPLESGGTIVDYKPGAPVDDNWRMTGRGSADDKAGVMAIINGYGALRKSGLAIKHNIKFFFEGEEEVGSIHLDEIFANHKEKLQSDIWIVSDGPRHVSGKEMVVFGVRGDVNMDLTVYGAKRPLHSGNYGNWAPNPAMMLVQLLASMKDDNGNVLIKDFYDDVIPLTSTEKKAIAAIPDIEETLKAELGIATADGGGKSFLELLHIPTLNINGINSANTGKLAANIIPVKADATLDLRLVAGNDVERQVQKVIRHIQSKGYHVIDQEPSDLERKQYDKLIKITRGSGYNAQRTPMDLSVAQQVIKAVQLSVDYPVILLPSAGGSLPLYLFEKLLNAKVITVPVVNYDNNQHAENENMKIGYLFEGIETIAAIMLMN